MIMIREVRCGEWMAYQRGLSQVKGIEKVTHRASEQQLHWLNNPLSIIRERSHCQLNIQNLCPEIKSQAFQHIRIQYTSFGSSRYAKGLRQTEIPIWCSIQTGTFNLSILINQPISDDLADYEDNSYKGKDTSNGSDQTRSHSVALIRGPCPRCPRRRGHQGPRSATGLFSSSISDRILLLSLPRG